MPKTLSVYTIGDLEKRYGCPAWAIRSVCNRGLCPAPKRLGAYRIWSEADLPKLEAALRRAGYIEEAK